MKVLKAGYPFQIRSKLILVKRSYGIRASHDTFGYFLRFRETPPSGHSDNGNRSRAGASPALASPHRAREIAADLAGHPNRGLLIADDSRGRSSRPSALTPVVPATGNRFAYDTPGKSGYRE